MNLNARALLRIGHGRVEAFHGRIDIDDLTLPDTFGVRLADPDHHDIAVVEHFADYGADFRGAHLQPHDDSFLR